MNETMVTICDRNFTVDDALHREGLYSAVTWLLCVPCVVAVSLNLPVVFSFLWIGPALWQNATLKLTLSLALSDVWTVLLMVAGVVYNSYLPFVLHLCSNACVAVILENIRLGGFITGTLHLLALSLNHYLCIAHPFKYRSILNPRNTSIVIGVLWVLPLLLLNVYASAFANEMFRSVGCLRLTMYGKFYYRHTIGAFILFVFLAASALYTHVIVVLRRLRTNMAGSGTKQSKAQLGRERKMFITTLLICGTFLLGWLLPSVTFALTCMEAQCASAMKAVNSALHLSNEHLPIISNLLIVLKSIVNPIIYAVRIPEINETLRLLVGKLLRTSSVDGTASGRRRQRLNDETEPLRGTGAPTGGGGRKPSSRSTVVNNNAVPNNNRLTEVGVTERRPATNVGVDNGGENAHLLTSNGGRLSPTPEQPTSAQGTDETAVAQGQHESIL